MKCDNCGKEGVRVKKVVRTYGSGNQLLIIENVPLLNCPNCGESYLTAETLHHIERLKTEKDSLAKERCVRSLEFA